MKLIVIGKLKEPYLKQARTEYEKRITKYDKIETIEIKEEKIIRDEKRIKEKESQKLLDKIKQEDYVIAFDKNGKRVTSKEFSKIIKKNLVYVIGGPLGLGEGIKKRANQILSFSDLTFPHQLFRIIALEQIYRAHTILNNEKYHK